jgi:SAM-dependent methyltransferase
METIRKPFEGIYNIVRFNWHFYVLALAAATLVVLSGIFLFPLQKALFYTIGGLILLPLIISLLISYYIYDLSELYTLKWMSVLPLNETGTHLNIHAGFDETSHLLKHRFPNSTLRVFDFYDPLKHTEVSIKRARKAYPPYPGTQQITTSALPLEENYADVIFLTLAAHEIRNEEERLLFFNELKRVLKPNGKILVTEHLRDLPNFLAYTVGFFHFLPKSAWMKAFRDASFTIDQHLHTTPFITSFILSKHGASS